MTTIESTIHVVETDEGTLRIDTRYFPVLIATWIGTISIELVDAYFDIRNPLTHRADAIGAKVVVITDCTRMAVPAVVRTYIAKRSAATDRRYTSMLGYVVVVSNPLVRGMIIAILWVRGDLGVILEQTSTLEAAYHETRRLYQEAGEPPPVLPLELRGGAS